MAYDRLHFVYATPIIRQRHSYHTSLTKNDIGEKNSENTKIPWNDYETYKKSDKQFLIVAGIRYGECRGIEVQRQKDHLDNG